MEDTALLLERYKVLEPLGEGGFSRVVKALDTKMDRVVAIKIISSGRERAIKAVREAKTVALLNHPNIVTLYEFERQDGNYYLIMEFVEGRSLAEIMATCGRLPIELALAIAVQVCDALSYAHQNDVIHRDIKPANLRILNDGRVKVMDFGVARLRGASKTGRTVIENEIVGTFAYMSPEQAGGEVADERSDLFSLGTLLYQMITGKLPFSADTPAGTIYKIVNEEPEPAHEVVQDVSPDLSRIIATALSKSPSNRWSGTDELKTELARCIETADSPAATAKEILGELHEPKEAGIPRALEEIRQKIASSLRQYQDTLTTTGFAVATAVCVVWADAYLPFFETNLKLMFPLIVFFLSLFLPPIGLAALLALMAVGFWQISPYLGAAAMSLFIVYWFALGIGHPKIAILPLLAPMVAWLKIPFLFPLAIGLVLSPLLGAFVAALGAFSLAVAEVVGHLRYAWSIGLRPDLIAAIKFNSQFKDLVGIYGYLKEQPWIIGQAGVWAAVAAVVSVLRSLRKSGGYLPEAVSGIATLTLGYKLVPAYLKVDYDFIRLFLQPMFFSLIILAILLFIFQRPPKRLHKQ